MDIKKTCVSTRLDDVFPKKMISFNFGIRFSRYILGEGENL